MSVEKLCLATQRVSDHTISARTQLLSSLRDATYRHAFVRERVQSSVALQIRALRAQRNNMTQRQLGDAIGMAQTWVSKLENPEYGKMTLATLLRLAEAFDTDLEIKFRPFSRTLDSLPTQGPDYYSVPSFEEEFGSEQIAAEDLAKVEAIGLRVPGGDPNHSSSAVERSASRAAGARESTGLGAVLNELKKPPAIAANLGWQERYGTDQSTARQSNLVAGYAGA